MKQDPYVPLELMLDKVNYSAYDLVVLASKRALEIAEGQPKMIEADALLKPSAIAFYEIANGKLVCKKPKA